jgi:hypothetical protein
MAALPSNVVAQAEKALSLSRKFLVFGEPEYVPTIAALESARLAVQAVANINPTAAQDWITRIDQAIAEVNEANARNRARESTTAVTSSGTISAEDTKGRANNSNTVTPVNNDTILTPTGDPKRPTNADETVISNQGTGAANQFDVAANRVVTTTNSQSIPPNTAAPGASTPDNVKSSIDNRNSDNQPLIRSNVDPTAGSAVIPTTQAGASKDGDDNTNPTVGTGTGPGVRTTIDDLFGVQNGNGNGATRIVSKNNVLAQFASSTYNISIYLVSKDQYNAMLRTKKKTLFGSQLLLSSGGAPLTGDNDYTTSSVVDGVITAVSSNRGRNQYFPLDYYIDDVKLEGLVNGKGTNGAHNITRGTFRLIEPNGISLLNNLNKAVNKFNSSQNIISTNYAAQIYLMVIRFYGYDQNGVMIKAGTVGPNSASQTTDPNAIVEKFIPFQFTAIKFRIANKLTEYECDIVCPQNLQGTGQMRGIIPFQTEFTSTNLKDLLTGKSGGDAINPLQSPQKADAARQPTTLTGLCEALNRYQLGFVAQGIFEIPDEYNLVILDPISSAKIAAPGGTNWNSTAMPQQNTAGGSLLPAKQSADSNSKNASAFAGMSIVQFIDQQVRNSTYIYDQQLYYNDPKTGKLVAQGIPGNILGWYRIGVQVEPKDYDFKRNDFAYKITYQISPYAVNDIKSIYFPSAQDRGAHKIYNYWFTGENTEILEFTQDFNYLYYIVVNNKQGSFQRTSDYREVEKRGFQANSNQSNQGQDNNVNEPSANAADYLYSPSDLSRTRLTILGDPAWLQQGELWSGLQGLSGFRFNYTPWLDDGTINYESQEPLFRVQFNTPTDYNLNTGLIDSSANNLNKSSSNLAGEPRQSFTYRAIKVDHQFRRGKFTQDIEGVLITYPLRNQDATATTDQQRPVVSTPAASTSRAQPTAQPLGVDLGAGATKQWLSDFTRVPGQSTAPVEGAPAPVEIINQPLTTTNASAPTSNGQVVGTANGVGLVNPTSTTNFQTGGVSINSAMTAVTVQLNNNTQQTVTSVDQIVQLYNSGLLSFASTNSAITQLESKISAQQQPVSSGSNQQIVKDY